MIRQRRAYIVDDDQALVRTVSRVLAGAGIHADGFGSAEDFLAGYSERPLGCLLLDLRLPGMTGIELLEHINQQTPTGPVIVLSGHGDVPSAVRAVKAGALDFLQKPFRNEQLLALVEGMFTTIENDEAKTAEVATLTPRERDVLLALSDGAPNKTVAARLNLSPRTVEMHRSRIYRRLNVTNLTQALSRARQARLID